MKKTVTKTPPPKFDYEASLKRTRVQKPVTTTRMPKGPKKSRP